MGGMHDCSIESTDTTRKGEMWFCTECHDQFTKQIKPQMMKKHRNVIFKGFKLDETDKVNYDEINKMIKEVRKDSEENIIKEMEVEAVVSTSTTSSTSISFIIFSSLSFRTSFIILFISSLFTLSVSSSLSLNPLKFTFLCFFII